MMKFVLVLYIATQWASSASLLDDLIIKLPDGQVQGATYVTETNKTYFGFRGIPYALPPIGVLRFEAPQPAKSWDGIWDATKDGNSCISINHWQYINPESEDCLYINVYTPELRPNVKLPVMFWIYGGGFIGGSSSKFLYGPDFLIEKDVIVVSFNYRLGPVGFLSTANTVIRGNAGLKDQSLALKWTHDNIAYFGGDPEKITIFGQSAGGASTGLHLLSKKSAGLFRGAIVQSGSALTMWSVDQNPTTFAFALADELSGENYVNDTQRLKEFLLEKSAEEIINATISLSNANQQPWPVLEVDDDDAFLSESPFELLSSGRFNQVPILIGICAEESLMLLRNLEYATTVAHIYDLDANQIIPKDLLQNSSDNDAVIKAIQEIYLNEGEEFSSNLVALADFSTDNSFTRGIIKHAEVSSGYVPAYFYQFAYYGRPMTEAFIEGAEKAAHSAELPFLFNMTGVSNTTDQADILTQNRVTEIWTNFAKFLNPTPEPSDLLNNVTWPTINSTNLQYVNINTTVDVRLNPRNISYPAWVNIFERYGKKPFITY